MYKYTATYTDYFGEERTEDFYFNLSKAELMEMNLRKKGGFEAWLQRIIKAEDQNAIVDTFKQIIGMSYGEKDDTGRRFIKSKELTEAFMQTEAYSDLFMKLVSDAEFASEFCSKICPQIEPPQDKPEVVV